MEELVQRVDTFIAVLDPICDGSTQLLAHLHFADSLRRLRSGHMRPRIFGVWLGEPKHVDALAAYPREVMSREGYHLLLDDSPPSDQGIAVHPASGAAQLVPRPYGPTP